MTVTKIISGGQTGADRAALDVAINLGIPHGGWVPKGRRTEDGKLGDKYQMKEMPTFNYPDRTEKNVLDSDGTLILSHGKLTGGSSLTRKLAKEHNRAWIHIDMDSLSVHQAARTIRTWISRHEIGILNVAGPTAGKDPEIYEAATTVLKAVFES